MQPYCFSQSKPSSGLTYLPALPNHPLTPVALFANEKLVSKMRRIRLKIATLLYLEGNVI
jgi:hypothetical protein